MVLRCSVKAVVDIGQFMFCAVLQSEGWSNSSGPCTFLLLQLFLLYLYVLLRIHWNPNWSFSCKTTVTPVGQQAHILSFAALTETVLAELVLSIKKRTEDSNSDCRWIQHGSCWAILAPLTPESSDTQGNVLGKIRNTKISTGEWTQEEVIKYIRQNSFPPWLP